MPRANYLLDVNQTFNQMAQKKKSKPTRSKPSAKSASSPKSRATKVKSHKYVFDFGKKTDGDAKQRELLGGKGANLAEMASSKTDAQILGRLVAYW